MADFDFCSNFPELCGYETAEIDVPVFFSDYENMGFTGYNIGSNQTLYSCEAYFQVNMKDVDETVENLNYFYNAGIEEGAYFNTTISMGARVWADYSATVATVLSEANDTYAWAIVPQLDAFVDYSEAESTFDDIYNDPTAEAEDHFDIMGEYWSATYIEDDRDSTNVSAFDVFTDVKFGYKVPANSTEDSTKIGILFSTEVPMEKMVYGDQLV